MMAGLLFARAGCKVLVLEKHRDFFRDFRGDTVHPSTMEILEQLGMLQRFLQRPHNRLTKARLTIAGRCWTVGDLSRIHAAAPFIAMMPQWEFLDLLREEAAVFPGFQLRMGASVERFLHEDGRISGVCLKDGSRLDASLTIAADGRHSLVRQDLLPVSVLGAPMDVLWFKAGRGGPGGDAIRGSFEQGRLLVMIDRGDYWQCAMVIPKGAAAQLLAKGVEPIRQIISVAAPDLELGSLRSADDLKLLSVSLDRLKRWHRPGLLAIGDAAHAMSPIGGVGINLAIQDAVAAANLLAEPLSHGRQIDQLLGQVQRRRALPTRIVQRAQWAAQKRIIGPLLMPGPPLKRAPWGVRLLARSAFLRRMLGRAIGLGILRETVQSPAQPPPGPCGPSVG